MLRIKLRANKRKATNSNDSPSIPQNEMEVTNINNTNNNPSIPQGTLSHSVSSSAKSMRTKRETLKENPTAWAEHKAREAARQRERRKNRSIQQKQRDTETARLRQAKFSTKRAAVGIDDHTNSKKKVKILTRTEKTKQREHWSEQQKSCRGKQSAQKKRRIREKDAYRHRLKRTQNTCKKSNSKNCPVETTEVQQTSFPTDSAKRKALSRMWSHMPRDPEKFAEVISTCIEGRRTTPRKRAALVAKGILSPSKCKQKLKFRQETWKKLHSSVQLLKKRSDDFARRDCRNLLASLMVSKKYRSQRMLSQTVGVTPNYLTNIRKRLTTTDTRTDDKKRRMRRKRSDVTCQDVIANVQQAYRSPVISRELPIMRRTAKPNLTPQRIMEVTISKAYKIWKKDNQDIRVSSSLFQKLRPDDVLLLRRNSFVQCLCEYCTDIMFLLHCLNHTAQMCGHKDTQLKDKYALIAATMCPKPEANRYGARDCISRSCDHCGVKLLKERYHKLLDESGQQQVIWKAWESKSYVHDGKTKSKKVLTTKSGSLQDLINELVDATKPLAKHLFVASWQQEMFSTISKHVPDSSVVIVCDFAENYTCVNQDEIQSAHWAQNQVTVHPIVCYYNCPDHNNHVVQEAIVIISSDIKHDAHAVNHFKHIAVTHLKEKRNVLFEKVIEFTDGCSNQYKSKIPFADISFSKQDMGVQLERHFFGSRHGKGPSDGVSGVVKSAVRRAVVSRQALVNNAVDMFGYCESNLTKNDCTSQMRTFFLVGDEDVIRERPERMVKSPVVGTLQFQAVKSVEPGVIGVRLLSCFCRNCLSDDGLCENSSYTHPWQQRVLKLVLPPPPEIIPETVITNLVVNIPVSESELALSDIWKSLTDGVQDEVPEDAYTEDLFRMLDEDSKKIPHVSATETVQPDDKPSKQTPDIAIVPEKYYAVDYIDRFYIGRVLTDKGAKWDMKFLHQQTKDGETHFIWPRCADIDEVHPMAIFYGPVELIGVGDPFRVKDLATITKAFHDSR